MQGLNRVTLIGHLGKDPEVNYLEGNVAVAKFTLATSESFKDKTGNWQDRVEWHNIVLWRYQAESAGKYLKKGSLVFIEGKIRNRSWTDKDNAKHYATDIVGDKIIRLEKKDGAAVPNAPAEMSSSAPATAPEEVGGDDLPF